MRTPIRPILGAMVLILFLSVCIISMEVTGQQIAVAEGDLIEIQIIISINTPGEYTWEDISMSSMDLYISGSEVPSDLLEDYPNARTLITQVWTGLIGHSVGETIFIQLSAEESPYHNEPESPNYGKNLRYEIEIRKILHDAVYEPRNLSLLERPEFLLFILVIPILGIAIVIILFAFFGYPRLKTALIPNCENCHRFPSIGICANDNCSARLCGECFGKKGCPFCDSNRLIRSGKS